MLTFCRLAAGRAGTMLGRRHRLLSSHASSAHATSAHASPSHALSSDSSHSSSSSDSSQSSSHPSHPTTSPDHDYMGINPPDPPLPPLPPPPPSTPAGAAAGEPRVSVDELAERLMQRQRRRGRPGEEAVIAVSFGVIRLDGDNQPLVHGQFEPGVMEGLSAGDVDSGLAEAMAERPTKSRVAWRDERGSDGDVGGGVSASDVGGYVGVGAVGAGSSVRSGKVASSGVADSELDSGDTYHALGLIDSQYFPDVPAETPTQKTRKSAADREPAHVPTTTLDSPPVDLFDEQYFAAAFEPATSSPIPSTPSAAPSASSEAAATADEPLPTLPPSSPLRSLQEDVALSRLDSHVVSEGGNGGSVSGGSDDVKSVPLGKLDGRPQGVFEEQYFWSAFEDTEEQRETERYKAGLAARHGEPPPRQGGSTEVKSTSGAPRWLGVSNSDGADGAVTDIGGVWPEEMVVPSPVAGPRTTASASPPPPPTQRPTAKAAEAKAAPSKPVKAAKAKAAPSEPTPAAKRQAGPAAATATAATRPGVRTALDAALEVRAAAAAARSDATSRGRQLRAERTDLSSLPSEAVLTMLRRGILHDAGDFVILYKPPGMSVHSATERYPHCLTDQLPELARVIGCERLLTVHRLDRDTSGALMLAKTTEAAHRLSGLLREGRVQKTYWALVRGEPELPRGVVDMPLELMTVAGRQRMGVPAEGSGAGVGTAPDGAQKAITRYRMLARGSGCALLELTPATGVRHQLRAHLGLGLGCPVLGDHKYSRWDTASRPQRLPPSTLTALGLRAAEARHMPMHLHARALWMPGLQHRVTAPLPVFFKRNLKRLKMAAGTVKGDGRYAGKDIE